MIALFWDIDGTLLTTGKAGAPAWEMAVREIVERDFELASFRVAGLTDYQIAVRTFEMLGVDADESTIRRMVARYEELLPTELPKKHGHVMPNVREILERMQREPDVHLYLLTGNTPGGARATTCSSTSRAGRLPRTPVIGPASPRARCRWRRRTRRWATTTPS